jgi:NAD(P)-dependent dehydrogenase (short-subunit alcohol dehydrogenase family)
VSYRSNLAASLTFRHRIENTYIHNTSNLVGVIGQADHAAYTATKGAMNTLTKSMALDYAPRVGGRVWDTWP